MKLNRKYSKTTLFIISILILGIAVAAGYMVYRSKHKDHTISTHALMVVTYTGGMCGYGPCNASVYNVYENGTFENNKKLNSSEVDKLKEIINTTDFLAYKPKSLATGCPSAVDGTDLGLMFPAKYGEKTFKPCEMDIPKNDTAITYIEDLIKSHYIDQN